MTATIYQVPASYKPVMGTTREQLKYAVRRQKQKQPGVGGTRSLVLQLKQAGQDEEWYPTTNEMILTVLRWIPKDANSIMDIGAGDGRVLAKFAEKCEDAMLYGIEKSAVLANAQPDNVVPVGTEFFEQNLSALPVDYVFCNPPYSQYEEWVCKIVSSAFSKKAFLVIPQRWQDSKSIARALKTRGAEARVIHSDDFLDGERPARAVIDIVEVTFPRNKWGDKVADPFDIWFDQHVAAFDKAKEEPKEESSSELARKFAHASIDDIVAAYRDEYARLEANYRAVFKLDYAILNELGVNKDQVREGLKKKLSGLKVKYWQILFDRLDAITSRLATKSKDKLLHKLTANTSVEFTAGNAYAVVIWAIKNANQYFDEQLIDLFHDLSNFEGVMNYKSNVRAWEKDGWRYGNRERKNTHYALDYRIVVSLHTAICKDKYSRWQYPGNLYKDCHDLIADVIAVFSNLGFSTYSAKSLDREWVGNQWQDFYESNTDDLLFQVKAFMNGNLHFRFNQKAIKALNVNAGRLLKWLRTEDDVVTELGYTAQEAKELFNRNAHILPNSVKLLGEGKP